MTGRHLWLFHISWDVAEQLLRCDRANCPAMETVTLGGCYVSKKQRHAWQDVSQKKTSLQEGDHFILPVSQPNLCVLLKALQVEFNKKVLLTSKQTLAVLNLAFLFSWFSFQSHRPSDQLVISASGLGRWLLQVRGCFQVTMLTKTSNF